jgi:hypothetical protein
MFVLTPDNPARKTAPGKAAEEFSFEEREKRPFHAA